MQGHTVNPEIERARKELEKLKQREHELEERLSVMYASASGDTYDIPEEDEEEKHQEGEEEIDQSEEGYKNVYNGQYIQNGQTHPNKSQIKDPWTDDSSKTQNSSLLDHRGNNNYSTLARAVTDKRVVNPSNVSNRTSSENEEVLARYPHPSTEGHRATHMDSASTDGDGEVNKHDGSSSYVPEDSDFEEHLFYHAYEERGNENLADYYGKDEISSSEFDDDAVDQRSEIHREIKINQQRERELRYERNMLSDECETESNSDSESVVSALSIRSKILKEIEEERMRDMDIQNQYRQRGLIARSAVVKERSDSTTSFDEALKQQSIEEKIVFVKTDVDYPVVHCSPAGATVMDLTGGGDASLRSKDNEAAQQQQRHATLPRVMIEEDADIGDSGSEMSDHYAQNNIDMRSRILKEIEEEQKREKELQLRLKRMAKHNAPLVVSSANKISVTNTASQSNPTIQTIPPQITTREVKVVKQQPLPSPPISITSYAGNHNNRSIANEKNQCARNGIASKPKSVKKIKQAMNIKKQTKHDKPTKEVPLKPHSLLESARSLAEIDKCTFSSREDLVAFLGTEDDVGEEETIQQEQEQVQPLKIPKVFTSTTCGYEAAKTVNSPKNERKGMIINQLTPITTATMPNYTDNQSGNQVKTKIKTKAESARNKSSVYFEAENQYMNNSFDDETVVEKYYEKPAKKSARSSKPIKNLNKVEKRGSINVVQSSNEGEAQKFSKPVTVSFTISKTIQRWERRIKKNALLL